MALKEIDSLPKHDFGHFGPYNLQWIATRPYSSFYSSTSFTNATMTVFPTQVCPQADDPEMPAGEPLHRFPIRHDRPHASVRGQSLKSTAPTPLNLTRKVRWERGYMYIQCLPTSRSSSQRNDFQTLSMSTLTITSCPRHLGSRNFRNDGPCCLNAQSNLCDSILHALSTTKVCSTFHRDCPTGSTTDRSKRCAVIR